MFTSSDQKQYKAFVKKLDNGFGLKMINTSNGVENVLIITSDSVLQSNNKPTINSQNTTLMPILSKFSQETVCSEPIASLTKSNLAINRILTHLEPYLKELKPDIAGFHVFEKDTSNSEPNIQKASVIVVANTKQAREKGVNINIPGKLMRVHGTDKDNIPFEGDSVIKPITIIVGDYIIHINICYDVQLSRCKTTGTQTRKGHLLTNSVDDDTDYNIKPLFYVPIQTEHKESQTENSVSQTKGIQTDGNILISETAQTPSVMLVNDCSTQTETVLESCSQDFETVDSNAIIHSFYLPNVKHGIENNIETNYQLISKRSKQSVTNAKSFSSLITFNSHTKCMFDTFNSHTKFNEGQSSLDTSLSRSQTKNSSSYVPESNAYELATTSMETLTDEIDKQNNKTENPETNTTVIFENFPENVTTAGSSAYLHIGTDPSSFDTMHQHSSTKLQPNILHTEKEKMRISAGNNNKQMGSSISNMSITEIKQHLNQTTLSLYQLYSVVEFIEDLSTKLPGENVEFIPKENTIRKLCLQNITPTNYTDTITDETLETKRILENEPLQDTLCDCCGLFFPTTRHHECVKDQQKSDGKYFNYADTDYKFVDNPQENHVSCHHVCTDIASISSETNVSKSIKYDTTCSAHCLTDKILNKADMKLNDSLIFYNKTYETMSKSSNETNFQSNPIHIVEKKENYPYNVDQNVGNLEKFNNAMIKEPNIWNETGLVDKIHKSKKTMQCHNFHQNRHRNNNITEHNTKELLMVIPLSKYKDIMPMEDTLALCQKRQTNFTDISKSMNNLHYATARNTIHEKKNNSSTKAHMCVFKRQLKSLFNFEILSETRNKNKLNSENEPLKITLEDSQNTVVVPCFNRNRGNKHSSVNVIFKNSSQFSSTINSSSSTLHIIPPSDECILVNRELSSVSNMDSNICTSKYSSKELKKMVKNSKTLGEGPRDKDYPTESEKGILKTILSEKFCENNKNQTRMTEKNSEKPDQNYKKEKFTKTKKRIFCFHF